jgi:hypothetical protein
MTAGATPLVETMSKSVDGGLCVSESRFGAHLLVTGEEKLK